jgi:hypothetical protein
MANCSNSSQPHPSTFFSYHMILQDILGITIYGQIARLINYKNLH